VRPSEPILDVGAGGGHALARFNAVNPIVALDLPGAGLSDLLDRQPNVRRVDGDARALPFADQEFPLVFSNSVIEHVGGWDDQLRFADEVRRVGRRYFVQTPNKWFPIEPHYQLPFIQFLPHRLVVALRSRFQLGHVPKDGSLSIRLLDAGALRVLFPDADIYRERVFGLTKSLMAVRRPAAGRLAAARGPHSEAA
jgi:SAM-dependent methyltransferase